MKKWLYTCYGNYASKSFRRIKDCISLDLIKSETNRTIIEKIYDKLQEKLDNNDVVSFFEEDEIVIDTGKVRIDIPINGKMRPNFMAELVTENGRRYDCDIGISKGVLSENR